MKQILALSALAANLVFTGCSSAPTAPPIAVQGTTVHGRAWGGQQPVAQAAVQLWAAGATGYGSASTKLITGTHTVTTDATGGFTITGDFTCPTTSSTPVYVTVTAGYPTPDAPNPNLALMAALGPCDGLANISFVDVNEITTVASVWALSPFMTGIDHVGTSATNVLGLQNAFAAINKLTNIATGTVGGPALPSGATLPVDEINGLADILASCVNSSGGTDNDGSPCGTLFHNTKKGTIAPTDTVTAAMNIAQNPAAHVTALYNEIPSIGAVFPTALPLPSAWTIIVNYTGNGIHTPHGIANDAGGNVWIANTGGNSVAKFDSNGAILFTTSTGAGSAPYALAVDAGGNAWAANSGNGSLVQVTNAGAVGATSTSNGLTTPKGVAIDSAGNIWVANSGAGGGLSEFTGSGDAVGNYTSNPAPSSIAINPE